jgi:hypothetical protein
MSVRWFKADHATRVRLLCAGVLAAAFVAGCGSEDAAQPSQSTGTVEALPQPLATGAVTGMPEAPGPGAVPLGGEPPPPPRLFDPDQAFGVPPLEDNPETGLGGAAQPEPTPADAVAVLRQYYAALAARDYAAAYGLWSDGGRASGLDPEQFAAGYARVSALDAQPGEPRPVEGAAGSRYVEVPLLLRTTHADGSVRTQAGRVVLRRAAADGGGAAQRAWRIASADLRDAAQP